MTCRLPVQLVFGRAPLDVERLVEALRDVQGRPVLFYDTEYEHILGDAAVQAKLAAQVPHVRLARIAVQRWRPVEASAAERRGNGPLVIDSEAAPAPAADIDATEEEKEEEEEAAKPEDINQRKIAGRIFEWPESELEPLENDNNNDDNNDDDDDDAPIVSRSWRSRLPVESFVPLWLGPSDSTTAKVIQVSLQRHQMQCIDVDTFEINNLVKSFVFSVFFFFEKNQNKKN